jgi:hypothetical protein
MLNRSQSITGQNGHRGNMITRFQSLARFALILLLPVAALAGPPFQTDDPQPIDYKHFEFYTFGSLDGTAIANGISGPAFELNWGALPNLHLHIIAPLAGVVPGDSTPKAYGLGDIELGIKYRFIQETKKTPMVGTFVMFEMPSGSASKGLGVGKTWYKVPLWAQKSWGPWTTYGGGGETLVNVKGYRNYPFAGWLLQRDLGKKWTLGTEAFYHGPEGPATAQPRPATLLDFGGYYKFRDPGFQFLFCYGHTIAGQRETYAYAGLYWTWGKEAPKPGDPDKSDGAKAPSTGIAFNSLLPAGLRRHS